MRHIHHNPHLSLRTAVGGTGCSTGTDLGGEEEEGLEAAENASQNRCMTLAEHANGQQSWKLIKAFYEVADTFPTTRLLVSGAQGRNFSLVSPQVTSLVAQYPELKIVTAGVRLFERCSNILVSVPPSDTQVR